MKAPMKIRITTVAVLLCLAIFSFLAIRAGRSNNVTYPDVTVATAKDGALDSNITADGSLVAANTAEVTVLPGVTAQVKTVYVNVGDHVRKGQILAELDPTDMADDLAQSVASEQGAKWQHQLVMRPYQPEQIIELRAKVASDRAAIKAASDHIRLLQNFRRPEEIQQAEEGVKIAEDKYNLSKTAYLRNKDLFDKDLLPRADLEASESEMNVNSSALNQAKSALSLLKQGARREEIDIAKSELNQAKYALIQDQQSLSLLLKGARKETVAVSAAHVAELAAITRHRQHLLERRYIKAPISGTIVSRGINPGEIAASVPAKSDVLQPVDAISQKSLFTIADDNELEFQANVDQMYFNKLRVGQEASINLESLPGTSIKGRIDRINQVINPEANLPNNTPVNPATPLTFIARVRLVQRLPQLAIGQLGYMSVAVDKPGVLVPASAVTPTSAGKGYVYVVQNGYANARAVTYDGSSQGYLRLLDGVHPGENVVVGHAQPIKDGIQVHPMMAISDSLSPKAF